MTLSSVGLIVMYNILVLSQQMYAEIPDVQAESIVQLCQLNDCFLHCSPYFA